MRAASGLGVGRPLNPKPYTFTGFAQSLRVQVGVKSLVFGFRERLEAGMLAQP